MLAKLQVSTASMRVCTGCTMNLDETHEARHVGHVADFRHSSGRAVHDAGTGQLLLQRQHRRRHLMHKQKANLCAQQRICMV